MLYTKFSRKLSRTFSLKLVSRFMSFYDNDTIADARSQNKLRNICSFIKVSPRHHFLSCTSAFSAL